MAPSGTRHDRGFSCTVHPTTCKLGVLLLRLVEGVGGGDIPWDPPSNPLMIKEDVHLMYGVKLLKKRFTLRMLNKLYYI